jgi:putative pyruvate formate lyase activating enzyme
MTFDGDCAIARQGASGYLAIMANTPATSSYPAYLALARTGELRRRAAAAVAALADCRCCPRACGVDRLHDKTSTCRIGRYARVSDYGPHHGEEECLRGRRGSGTIFFAGCNLGCAFCQNWEISHECAGAVVTPERLAGMMLELQATGCHNLNWVTPTHVVPQTLEALAIAADQGLRLPIVYNTGGYDSPDTLRLLDGIVDIYMPDFKIWDPLTAAQLVKARDYPEWAREAIREMHRQVGPLELDADGLARRGVLVRHLVMPNGCAGTPEIARWLATELSAETYVNVMDQYHPAGSVLDGFTVPGCELHRRITREESRQAMSAARASGLHRFA